VKPVQPDVVSPPQVGTSAARTDLAPPTAQLQLGDKTVQLPIVIGTENDRAVDISHLREHSGFITLDEGYANTGACCSSISYVDGDKGVLRYRGIPIEQLAEHSTFVETAWFLIYGELPTTDQLRNFRRLLTEHEMLHEGLHNMFNGFPQHAPPMATLSAMINACSCYHSDILAPEDRSTFESAAARLISKVRTIAAASYKTSIGHPIVYPNPKLSYCENFLHMMFTIPNQPYEPDEQIVRALNLLLILHADHEQNCSTSTVRMVASSGANLFASCAAGVCALWGPLHGGANVAVIDTLEMLHKNQIDPKDYIAKVKDKSSGIRLMGFGHRVYKYFDPRAQILRAVADKLLSTLKINDPLLDTARRLEEIALQDSYFKDRHLYPNVDFYSGIVMRAMGLPVNMFTVLFAIGRTPGWVAHWKEVRDNVHKRIDRPRQVYIGHTLRDYVPIEMR
jgi:citrate synthase